MIVGCPKEIKDNENRVGLTPHTVKALTEKKHEVLVEKGAGLGSGFADESYIAAGAVALKSEEVWSKSDLIVKVKEPLPPEYPLMKLGQIIFAYFHLSASLELTKALLERQISAVAYETIMVDGALPLLKPMSEVAGRMAVLMGAYFLAGPSGGSGLLATGVTGSPAAEILIIGGGVVGQNAALVGAGLGAKVTLLEKDPQKTLTLPKILPPSVEVQLNSSENLRSALARADIIVGAVLSPGARAPIVVTRATLKLAKPGSVVVDVAIDQGGCFETSRLTTHSQPTYVEEGLVHYCVGNMPGAYPRTSTVALSEVTRPYVLTLADLGLKGALSARPALRGGLATYNGILLAKPVAEDFNLLDLYRKNPW
ncbi:MAG: alanine dehydrogenase [Deltaproteobacteria bacterium]|jgi:alanine dehydrogenase|nr:alanine dehydrogenase [Deltaproteobacteria bacterium]